MTGSVSQETVDAVIEEMDGMDPGDASALSTRMREEQPTLQGYLVNIGEPFNQDDKEIIFYIGVAAWQMISRGSRMLGRVTKSRLEHASRKNIELVTILSNETGASFLQIVEGMIAEYPEPEVLRYITEALVEKDPDDIGLRDEVIGLAFIHLKIALDALILSLWKSRQGS